MLVRGKIREFSKRFGFNSRRIKLEASGIVFHLQKLEKNLLVYHKELFTKKRNPASHLLVFVIANKLCNTKPYATSIQFKPIKSITDQQIRLLEIKIKVAGKNIRIIPVR